VGLVGLVGQKAVVGVVGVVAVVGLVSVAMAGGGRGRGGGGGGNPRDVTRVNPRGGSSCGSFVVLFLSCVCGVWPVFLFTRIGMIGRSSEGLELWLCSVLRTYMLNRYSRIHVAQPQEYE